MVDDEAPVPIASLPMYDWPEVSADWDALWRDAAHRLNRMAMTAPASLTRGPDHASWTDPDLLIGQTCGWPFISRPEGEVVPFGRFAFEEMGGKPGDYHSVIVMPKGTPGRDIQALGDWLIGGDAVIAVNGLESQSGFRALGECFTRPVNLTGERLLITGSHRESICAVAQGRAALAAIDAISWRLAMRFEPASKNVSAVACTRPVPGLPLICAPAHVGGAEAVRDSLDAAARENARLRDALGLVGVAAARAEDYEELRRPPFGNLTVS